MRKLLLVLLLLLAARSSHAQDSAAANYIKDYIGQVEARLENDILEKTDTIIQDSDTSRKFLKVHTDFFTDPRAMQVEKIIEKSSYQGLETEITIYYRFNQPVRFSSLQKRNNKVVSDFDVYYINNSAIHFTCRTEIKGKPDGDQFIGWCTDLLKDYEDMVASRKAEEMQLKQESGSKSRSKFIFSKPKKKSG